jgi:hypothetical protein
MPERASIADWTPGLDEMTTLRAVYESMPGDDASTIPWYVRLLENPASPVAFPGAIDLFGHDCVHIALGRGMLPQDEAFVIGYTMGASGKLSSWRRKAFAQCARYLYGSIYRFSDADRQVFNLAVDFAIRSAGHSVHDIAWRHLLDLPLGEIRSYCGICTSSLIEVFNQERMLFRDSAASQRLPQRNLDEQCARDTRCRP